MLFRSAYLYGYEEIWIEDNIVDEKVMNEMILFLGVMFGVSGSTTILKLVSSGLSKQIMKTLHQKALTKTVYYPILKNIAKCIGVKLTKTTFSNGVAKVVPVMGGIVSGSITYLSMKPMGKRLKSALEEAQFDYSEEEIYSDLDKIATQGDTIIDMSFGEQDNEEIKENQEVLNIDKTNSISEELIKCMELVDLGVLTQEEISEIKRKLIDHL